MAMKKRVVIVGLGSIGRRHARLLKERDDTTIEGVEPNTDSLAECKDKLGDFTSYTSFDAMLKSAPEIVLIATPFQLHAEQTVKALDAGCHVLCEKPMSDSLDDAKKMKAAADKNKRILNIGFNLHFSPCLQKLKACICRGTLGKILHAHVRVGAYQTLTCSQSRYQSDFEGALIFDYAHQPDILYWLLNEIPSTVFAGGLQAGNFELTSNPNFIDILSLYKTPLMTTIHLNYAQSPVRHEYEIVGDKGWARLDVNESVLKLVVRSDVKTESIPHERDKLYRDEHQAFFDAVDGKRVPETSADDGLVSTAICLASLKSCKSRSPVNVEIP